MRFVPNSAEGGAGAVTMPPPAPRPRRKGRGLVAAAGGVALVVAGLAGWRAAHAPSAAQRIAAQADSYVTLVLMLGRIDPTAVDAYFGPAALLLPTDRPAPRLADIRARAMRLLGAVEDDHAAAFAPRRAALAGRVRHLVAVIDASNAGAPTKFDDEARRLYGIDVGRIDTAPLDAVRLEIARLLPGAGPLPQRVAAFRTRLAVPPARRAAVFARALDECRRRTQAHWPMSRGDHVDIRWTDTVPAAWHRYQGGARSTIDVNPRAVAFVGAAIDTACHEAYPGHHAQFAAMEAAAGAAGLPVEQRIELLRAPEAVLREGAANYGVRLAFPLADRTAFARDTLYPLAGLPPAEAARDMRVHQLLGDLELSVAPILRAYSDGALPFDRAVAALRDQALVSSPEVLLGFVDQYGPLVLGYTLARERVAAQVAARGARTHRDAWAVLHEIVATEDVTALAPVTHRTMPGVGS